MVVKAGLRFRRLALIAVALAGLCLLPFHGEYTALGEVTITIVDHAAETAAPVGETEAPAVESAETAESLPLGNADARKDFIDSIIALAKKKLDDADGRLQRAHYKSDIYVCKNFTVYLFRENRDRFRMAEFPSASLVIADNQTRADCAPYAYGVEWKDIPAEKGNPFYAAATFRYDDKLSKDENFQKAREFLQQVQRGDYFQMAANYRYGVGAHSMIFIEDYDSATDSVHWTDSNMRGGRKNNMRYGYVQYDEVKEIDFFVDAFCRKKHGATLYRLREDIIYKP